VTFVLKGVDAMRRRILQLARQFPGQVDRALGNEGELVMTRSKRDHVPVDLAALMNSGHVDPPKRRGKDVEVRLSYGGPAAPYAEAVHEHPSSHSPPSWQGVVVVFHPSDRGPKYLQQPLMDAVAGMDNRIAMELRL